MITQALINNKQRHELVFFVIQGTEEKNSCSCLRQKKKSGISALVNVAFEMTQHRTLEVNIKFP